jgi:DNA mismatch repair ATPase MutS
MQLVDSLERGQSTYMAELERARQLLEASRDQPLTLVLIDELFAGTNHLESIAAGSAVLSTLCERSAVIVATHDVVLARLLDGRLRPLCLRADEADRAATLHLAPGLIADTNGIAMMGAHGFSQELVQQAQAQHARLTAALSRPVAVPIQGDSSD